MKNQLVIIGLLGASLALPAHALRCGNQLVSVGDRKARVLRVCGEPESRDERIEYRSTSYEACRRTGHDRFCVVHEDEAHQPVRIEEWTYNFGTTRFMQLLEFENGVLKRLESMEYGY